MRVVAGPSEEAWKCALYNVMLHYAYENRHTGIVLTKKEGAQLNAFVDVSNKGDHGDNRRVAMGHVAYLGNSPIDWRCTKTLSGTQSTQHAEYMGCEAVTKAVVWLRQMLTEMKQTGYNFIKGPTVVRCDNKPAIALVLDDIITIGNRFNELAGH